MKCIAMLALVACVACGGSQIKPENPVDVSTRNALPKCAPNCDGFDKAGDVVAASSRWTYGEVLGAYAWLTSDTNSERAKAVWKAFRASASEGFDAATKAAKKAYDKYEHDHSK